MIVGVEQKGQLRRTCIVIRGHESTGLIGVPLAYRQGLVHFGISYRRKENIGMLDLS